jgi:hypothetical protein
VGVTEVPVVAEQHRRALVLLEGVPARGYMLGTLYVSPTMALSLEAVEAVEVAVEAAVDLNVTHMLKLLTKNQERP